MTYACEDPGGRETCGELSTVLAMEELRTDETESLLIDVARQGEPTPAADVHEAYEEYQIEFGQEHAPGTNPYDLVAEYAHAQAIGWCVFMDDTDIMCPDCPLRPFLPTGDDAS